MFADLLDPSLALRPAQPAAQTLAALTPSGYAPAIPGTIRKANEVPSNMIGPAAPSSGGTGGVTAAQVLKDNAAGAVDIARREGKGAFAPAGFASALGRTFQEEGGFNARDANGAPVNFGINQAAHPEVDVSKLAKDQAAAIYKRDYWDKIGGDVLAQQNPALAHVAFDMAVVAGPDRALEMIKQSGGDAAKFMDLRALYLEGLVRSNPATYGRYAQTWRSRDQHLREDIGAVSVRPDPGFKMEIAEGPATTMTDATTAPVQASDAAALEPPPEVRAALGMSPVTPRNVESPEQIIPPEIRKALGMSETGGYQTDASGNLTTPPVQKPQVDPTEVQGVTEFGEPIFKDPAKQREFQQGEADFGKGVVSGMAQDVTGVGEWLPNQLGGGKAAEATRYLQGVGAPVGQKFGRVAPLLLPLGDAAAAIGGGAKALSEGAPIAAKLLSGARSGAIGGGLASGAAATGEPDTGRRLVEKGEDVLEGGAVGAALGGAGPAVLGGAKWLGSEAAGLAKTITGGYGREAEKTAEELRSGVSAETGKAMSSADRAKREAALDQRAGERRLAGQEAEYQRAEASAQKIAADFAARPLATPAELGRKIHAAAAADMKELKDARTLESGYDAAVNADRGQPSVPTRQFLNRVSEAETRAKSTLMKSALSDLRDQLWTTTGGTRRTAVSTAGARRIIQDMDGKIDGLNAAGKTDEAHELEKMKDDFVEYLEGLKLDLKAAREKYAELSRPLDVYRDKGALAKPAASDLYSKEQVVDSTRIVGALLNGTESGADALARVVAKNPAMLEDVRGYFNKQLLEMAGEKGAPTPEQFGRFLNRNRIALERVGAVARTGEPITVAESSRVMLRLDKAYDEQNRYVLTDASGKKLATILASPGRDFRISSIWGEGKVGANSVGPSTMRGAAEAVKKMHPEVETFSGMRTTGARNATGRPEAGGVEASVPFASRGAGPKPPLLEEFTKLKGDVGRSQEAVRMADEARTETQKSIQQLSKDRTTAEITRRDFKEFQSALDTVAPREAAATASSAIEKLHKSGYLTDAQLDDFNRQIRGVKDRYKDADEALHTLRYRIWPAVAAAAGAVGIGGVTEYFSHRIRP